MAVSDGSEDNTTVSYSVKELLEQINQRLEHIDDKLDDKVSYAQFVALYQRLDRLEGIKDRMVGGAIALTLGGGGIGAAIGTAAARIING